MSSSDNKKDKEHNLVLQMYGALGAAMILSLVPNYYAALLSLALGMAVLIMGYVIRAQRDQGSYGENHMTFIIRTIWIGSFLALLVLVIGSVYLFNFLDNDPLLNCLDRFAAMGDEIYEWDVFRAVFRPCEQSYLDANLQTFIISGAIVGLPTLIYFSARFIRGLTRAFKGYRVSDPRSWF